MVLTNILYRTFFIRAAQYGTAFTLEVDGTQYLITARHLLVDATEEVELQIMHDKKWLKGRATVVGLGEGEVDIAVLQIEARLTPPGFDVTPSTSDMFLGQEVYFLGFPYKMWAEFGELMANLPGPFVKKGTLSSVQFGNPQMLYVDAINNEGFSGGPLYFFPQNQKNELRIAGVVSKYITDYEVVIDAEGNRTDMSVPYNTGFLIAYGIKHALEIIKQQQNA